MTPSNRRMKPIVCRAGVSAPDDAGWAPPCRAGDESAIVITMAGVWMWVRRDARRRARALVGIALLVAVASAVVLATVAGGRRNGSAFSRLFEKSAAADVMVLPNTPGFDWNEIRKLAYVDTVGEFDLAGHG